MKFLIASLVLVAGPLAAHPVHGTFSAPVAGAAVVLLATLLLVAKRVGLGN